MSSPRSWLFVLLRFALSADAKGGGKGSGSKSSKKGSKSKPIPQTVVYQSGGKCYNEQHVLINCPYSKSMIITTIVLGTIAGILILTAIAIWCLNRYKQKKNRKSVDAESKGIHSASEGSRSNASLVHGETDRKDGGGVGEYGSDDESTYCDHTAEKVDKY